MRSRASSSPAQARVRPVSPGTRRNAGMAAVDKPDQSGAAAGLMKIRRRQRQRAIGCGGHIADRQVARDARGGITDDKIVLRRRPVCIREYRRQRVLNGVAHKSRSTQIGV